MAKATQAQARKAKRVVVIKGMEHELYDELHEIALREERSIPQVCRRALRDWIEGRGSPNPKKV